MPHSHAVRGVVGDAKTGSLGEYLGPKLMRMGSGKGFIIRNLIVCTVHLISSGWLNEEDQDGQGMYQEWKKIEVLSVNIRALYFSPSPLTRGVRELWITEFNKVFFLV